MISISTKTGDDGTTSLANGQRVAKDSLVLDLLGNLDELSSWLGLVISNNNQDIKPENKDLIKIQHHLYLISGQIAQAAQVKLKRSQLIVLEKKSIQLQNLLQAHWHHQFLYPGGTKLAAELDIARTVCRRCERSAFKYYTQIKFPGLILKYLNRLSDYLYLLRCIANQRQNYLEKKLSS